MKGCELPSHRGFRVCFDCMRGFTPERKKVYAEEAERKAKALDEKAKRLEKEFEAEPKVIDTLNEEQALNYNMASPIGDEEE